MNILITGGAGFIGSHLSEKLLKKGNKVAIIDNLLTGRYKNFKHLIGKRNFSYKIASILNGSIEEMIKNADQVYHLAAAVGVKNIIDNPLESMKINIQGTERVLELANKYKKKVLMASTSEIYGKSAKVPYAENDDRLIGSSNISRWSYSASKAVDEFLSLAYYREKKLPVVIVRLFNTIGPKQTGLYGMVVPRFIKNALLNHPITIYGDGKQSRCFAYVDDVIQGMVDLMDCKEAEGEIFNIGSYEEITIEDLAKLIVKMIKSKSKIEYIPYDEAYEEGFEDMRRRIPDIKKIIKIVNYKINNDLQKSIEKIIKYYEE